MTTFDEFMAEVEAEAETEGKDAVAELPAASSPAIANLPTR
jgi:hypothetical protein